MHQVELRLTCLDRGCEERSQCYLVDDAIAEIETASTLRIVMYVTSFETKVNTVGMETAVAQWLDLDPAYVSLPGCLSLALVALLTKKRPQKGPAED